MSFFNDSSTAADHIPAGSTPANSQQIDYTDLMGYLASGSSSMYGITGNTRMSDVRDSESTILPKLNVYSN